MINWKFCCSPLLFFYFDYYYYFLDLKYEKTKSFILSQFSCTLINHYLYFKIWLYVRYLWIEITVTSCMFPWLDSDVKCVEGEKQRVRMLSQTPRYVRISNRIYSTKSIPQTSRIPHRENNAPQSSGFPSNTWIYTKAWQDKRPSFSIPTWYFHQILQFMKPNISHSVSRKNIQIIF